MKPRTSFGKLGALSLAFAIASSSGPILAQEEFETLVKTLTEEKIGFAE